MKLDRAVDLIEQVTYKPGWTFRPYVRDGVLHVEVEVHTQNSDVAYAPHYRTMIWAGDVFKLDAERCHHEQDLWSLLITAIMEIELHEAQEFFAVNRRYEKPYHPHTYDGVTRWKFRRRAKVSEGGVTTFTED